MNVSYVSGERKYYQISIDALEYLTDFLTYSEIECFKYNSIILNRYPFM